MKIILVGYPGSQHIVPASRYLLEKYLPGFELHWLNWVDDINGWGTFVATYLAHLDDERVIFTLDDYLVTGFDKELYEKALKIDSPSVKLCATTEEEHEGYPVTTQYTLWDRKTLIQLLSKSTTPWNFEMSNRIDSSIGYPAIKYDTHSALSSRWKGVNWNGVSEEDLKVIQNL